MGKSTVAQIFRAARIPVFDADRAVHSLQGPNGKAVAPIAALAPGLVVAGAVDRRALRAAIAANPAILPALERILHPMVRDLERRFLAQARRRGATLAVLDVPLLFETGGDRRCDLTIAVSAPPDVQLRRVAGRGSMSAADANRIIARQMPDRQRRRLADIVVRTGLSRNRNHGVIRRLLASLRENTGSCDFIKKSSQRGHG